MFANDGTSRSGINLNYPPLLYIFSSLFPPSQPVLKRKQQDLADPGKAAGFRENNGLFQYAREDSIPLGNLAIRLLFRVGFEGVSYANYTP